MDENLKNALLQSKMVEEDQLDSINESDFLFYPGVYTIPDIGKEFKKRNSIEDKFSIEFEPTEENVLVGEKIYFNENVERHITLYGFIAKPL